MRPRIPCFAAIADVLPNATRPSATLVSPFLAHSRRLVFLSACPPSVLYGEAVDLVFLEIPAGRLGALLVQPGKARAIERFLALVHPFGERVGLPQDGLADALRRMEALARLAFIGERADLDDPAGARWRLGRGRNGGGRCGGRLARLNAGLAGSDARPAGRRERHGDRACRRGLVLRSRRGGRR